MLSRHNPWILVHFHMLKRGSRCFSFNRQALKQFVFFFSPEAESEVARMAEVPKALNNYLRSKAPRPYKPISRGEVGGF